MPTFRFVASADLLDGKPRADELYLELPTWEVSPYNTPSYVTEFYKDPIEAARKFGNPLALKLTHKAIKQPNHPDAKV